VWVGIAAVEDEVTAKREDVNRDFEDRRRTIRNARFKFTFHVFTFHVFRIVHLL
jgi:hypothetical protein